MNENEKPKLEPKESHEDPQEIEAAETEARKRAIESEQKEIVVFPESSNE